MAYSVEGGRLRSEQSFIRVASDRFLTAADVAREVENMFPTEEGSLRSVWGPAPWNPDWGTGGAPPSADTPDSQTTPETYGEMHGIWHGTIDGRDILLVHTGGEIWEFEGWDRQWRVIFRSFDGLTPVPRMWAPVSDPGEEAVAPTQFTRVPNGVIITPCRGRSLFYDGRRPGYFGFTEIPGAPTPLGPMSSRETPDMTAVDAGINSTNYAVDALAGRNTKMHRIFHNGRIGDTGDLGAWTEGLDSAGSGATVTEGGIVSGDLLPSEYAYAVQLIDFWGNLSPMSGLSNAVWMQRQPALGYTSGGGGAGVPVAVEKVKKQFLVTGLPTGDRDYANVLGRIILRSKNRITNGPTMYEVPLDSANAPTGTFATVPDNSSEIFPDNIPDEWLAREATDVAPMPEFRHACMAMGVLWVADGGRLQHSIPGRWGTIAARSTIYPDPSGSRITGLSQVANGLLVFTERSTFLVVQADDGRGFKVIPLSKQVGCIAPSSIQSTPGGLTIWLGREGFYAYDGAGITMISGDISYQWHSWNKGRLIMSNAVVDVRTGEYRCWVPIEGSRIPNRCYIYDGTGWRWRTDVNSKASCVKDDHTGYVLVAGQHGTTNGVWVQDHETQYYDPISEVSRSSKVDTSWILNETMGKDSVKTVYLWLVETGDGSTNSSGQLQVKVYRDWRETVIDTFTVELYPTDDADSVSFWGTATLGADDTRWRRRRPYWAKVDVHLPSCEVFKLQLVGPDGWEFLGMAFDRIPQDERMVQ